MLGLMKKKKILFIVNPNSGTGKQDEFLAVLNNKIDTDLFNFDIEYTEYRMHAVTIAKNALGCYDIVVAVGGDGTVNEVAKGLIGSDVVLGIIPIGSGNGLSRHLGLPLKIAEAITIINDFKTQKIDTIEIDSEVFVNVAGVGFDAHVAHLFANTKKRGALPYVKHATIEFQKYESKWYSINIDGATISRKAFAISLANSSQFGNNAYISPNAKINDGLIDVCIMNEFPKVEAGQLAVKLFNKRLDKSKYMKIIQGKNVKITSNEEMPGHIDGEPVHFSKEIEIKINPLSLNVIYNALEKKNLIDLIHNNVLLNKLKD